MAGFIDRLCSKGEIIAAHLKMIYHFPKNFLDINKIIKKETYYPELTQKGYMEKWFDNFRWLCKYGSLNKFYTSYGLDIKGFRNARDFLELTEFIRARNAGNQVKKYTESGHYNYIVTLRDKYLFASYLSNTIGKQYLVEIKALIVFKKVYICAEKKWCTISEFLKKGEIVIKKIDGECADEVMLVQITSDSIFVNDKKMAYEQFIQKIGSSKYIVQDVVKQHSVLRIFKTRSINTIRIVTIKGRSGEIGVFAAFLRLSGSADSFVDNRAKGGLGIGIYLESGCLMQYGFPHDTFGVKVGIHPHSKVCFADVQLPYWKETVELVCNAHRQFYELQSIGWDVVLSENGPILLEGNDDWEIGGPQDTYGGLKARWNKMINS